MASTPAFGFNDLFTHVVGEIAAAVCERSGETAQQQFARSQAAVHMTVGFLPRDVIETMLAGHCVMLHETMLASVHDTMLGEADAMRRSTRSAIVAMNKEFNNNLGHLERYQSRPSLDRRTETRPAAARPADAGSTAPKPASPAARPAPETPVPPAEMQAETADPVGQQAPDRLVQNDPSAGMDFHPSPAMVEACQNNPEAMAALAAGDPARFARALGISNPDEAFLAAAAAPGSPFDPASNGPWPAAAASGRRSDQ